MEREPRDPDAGVITPLTACVVLFQSLVMG
jgi:hypothetical protein